MGQVSRTGLVPFLNFWIPCCQMFAVNMCYSQNVTSSSGPTLVSVRDLRWLVFLCMGKTTVICFAWVDMAVK